jgi:hypothetical protein
MADTVAALVEGYVPYLQLALQQKAFSKVSSSLHRFQRGYNALMSRESVGLGRGASRTRDDA